MTVKKTNQKWKKIFWEFDLQTDRLGAGNKYPKILKQAGCLEEVLAEIEKTQKELICRFKPDTTLTFVNKAYCNAIGLSEEEIIGRKYIEFIPEEDREFALEKLEKARESQTPQKYEHKVEGEDGEISYQRWTDYPIFDNRGEIEGFQAVGTDITEIKKKEEEIREKNRLLEGVINSIPDIIGIQKPDHSIMRYNKTGYDMLDLPSEEIKGQKCYELLDRNKACENCTTEKALKTKKLEETEKYFPELDTYFHCRSNPIID